MCENDIREYNKFETFIFPADCGLKISALIYVRILVAIYLMVYLVSEVKVLDNILQV